MLIVLVVVLVLWAAAQVADTVVLIQIIGRVNRLCLLNPAAHC